MTDEPLRSARLRRYRDDKPAALADTMDTVRAIYLRQTGLPPPERKE